MSLSLLLMIASNGLSEAVDTVRLGLEASSAYWFGIVKDAGYAVAFGCALEAPETFVVLKRWWFLRFRDDERDETREQKRSLIVPLAAVGLLIIVAGIVVETYAEGRVSDFDALLRAHESDKVSAADSKAEIAEQKAAAANGLASADEKKAGELQKTAEDERLARVKIEAAVAFRQLTPEQKKELGDGLAKFRGQVGVSFWYEASDTEAQLFADDIAEALKAKGAIIQPPANIMTLRETGKYGDPIVGAETGVTVLPSRIGAAPDFSDALIKELNDFGFDAKRRTNPPFSEGKYPEVEVKVEARPKGPQGEYKLHPISKK